jgi:hypothetical protein
MKKITLITSLTLSVILVACGARDDKNKVENYPTYDTTQPVDPKNDDKNPDAGNAEGDLRHNMDDQRK